MFTCFHFEYEINLKRKKSLIFFFFLNLKKLLFSENWDFNNFLTLNFHQFFLQGGVLVAVVRGANSPKILRTITEQLQQEHKVIDGQSERKEVRHLLWLYK